MAASGVRVRPERNPSARKPVSPVIEPVIIIIVGVTLVLVLASAREVVPGALRTSALAAALILVSRGLNDLKGGGAAASTAIAVQIETSSTEPAPAPAPSSASVERPASSAPALPDGRAINTAPTITLREDPPPPPPAPNSGLSSAFLGLAIWLALASLAYRTAAPATLILLSLLSAYLLFSEGWRMLRQW